MERKLPGRPKASEPNPRAANVGNGNRQSPPRERSQSPQQKHEAGTTKDMKKQDVNGSKMNPADISRSEKALKPQREKQNGSKRSMQQAAQPNDLEVPQGNNRKENSADSNRTLQAATPQREKADRITGDKQQEAQRMSQNKDVMETESKTKKENPADSNPKEKAGTSQQPQGAGKEVDPQQAGQRKESASPDSLCAASKSVNKNGMLPAREPMFEKERNPYPNGVAEVIPGLDSFLLEGKPILRGKEEADDIDPKWKPAPKIKDDDYLLHQVPEEKRKIQPCRVLHTEDIEEDPHVGKFASYNLYSKWLGPYKMSVPDVIDAKGAIILPPQEKETETKPKRRDSQILTTETKRRVYRRKSKDALNTFLLEAAEVRAWKHRSGLHSELRHNPAISVEAGTDIVASKLEASRKFIHKLDISSESENVCGDPYGPNARPEDPLPFTIGLPSEQTEFVALSQITKAAKHTQDSLQSRFPFLDISWSRQPSFDDTNVDELFRIQPKTTEEDCGPTKPVLDSHQRVRLAASRVSQCLDSKDPSGQEALRLALNINLMYMNDKALKVRKKKDKRDPWTVLGGFYAPVLNLQKSSKFGDPDELTYRDPEHVADLWKYIDRSYEAAKDEEETERLELLSLIVHDIHNQFGGAWSNRLHPTSVLIKMLRTPQFRNLNIEIPNPQALITKYIMLPNEVVELVHSLFIPLIMERFYLFDPRFSDVPKLFLEEATTTSEWCLATRALCRMGRISNYLLTVILESRVPGLLRLLFRLNALEFFEYRISYSLHMFSWSGQNNYDPSLQFERKTRRTIRQYRTKGSLAKHLMDSCTQDEKGKEAEETDDEGRAWVYPLLPELSFKDKALLLRRAKSHLYALLQNGTTATAMRYNVEAITKLLPFVTEYNANMATKETICDRLIDSDLTKAVFWAIGDHAFPETPQAVSLITSYLEMLTEALYAMRSSDMMKRINHAKHSEHLGMWQNLCRGLEHKNNAYVWRALLCFIADLLYMTCLDGAPFLLSFACDIHKTLDEIVIPIMRENRENFGHEMTWDYCWRAAVCLREAFNKTKANEAIKPNILFPYTMVNRCGLRAAGPWPSLWKAAWEPEYHSWSSEPSYLEQPEKPTNASVLQTSKDNKYTTPKHRLWKGSVIPCWLPGCTNVLFQQFHDRSKNWKMHYCPGCFIASYCSKSCRKKHYVAGHSQVCCYFKRPPTFLRFHMLKDQIPRQMKYPIMRVFYGLCDFNMTFNLKPEDFQPIF